MRLINAHSLKLEDFRSAVDAPVYAVLSHTWGEAESNFTEWNSHLTRLREAKQPAFAKVYVACKQARRDGISHVWVDAICIDKSSSAELSEAINSMYFWYQSSKLCYVYLKDVSGTPSDQIDRLDLFKRSSWFTRGWTLQKLHPNPPLDRKTVAGNLWRNGGASLPTRPLSSDPSPVPADPPRSLTAICQTSRLPIIT
ncbi:het domain-containing protein [Seiridium cupressi]